MTSQNVEQLWLEYHPKVYGYFFRRVNNRLDVEDLTSITLSVFVEKVLNPDIVINSPQGFLWKIAHNQLLVFINLKTKSPLPATTLEDFENYQPEQISIETTEAQALKFRKEKLLECVQNQLTETESFIVEKLIMEDVKAVDLAKQTKQKPENIRQKLSRSLKKLRDKCKQIWES